MPIKVYNLLKETWVVYKNTINTLLVAVKKTDSFYSISNFDLRKQKNETVIINQELHRFVQIHDENKKSYLHGNISVPCILVLVVTRWHCHNTVSMFLIK